MHPLPTLPAYPTESAPSAAQRLAIDQRINTAIDEIDALLAPNSGADAYLDAVFGPHQRATVIANFGAMRQALIDWRDTPGRVRVSGWMPRFQREAHTVGATKIITLPDFGPTPATLPRTLIHESAHGASSAIVDTAYETATVAFQLIPGPARPLNAPYYDFALFAWRAGTLAAAKLAAGNPNTATGPAVKVGSPQQSVVGVQFQRAQSVVTHARIHAENMLQALTEDARNGQVNSARMNLSDGLPMPFLPKYKASWVNSDLLTATDIDALNTFVLALTAFHASVSALTYKVEIDNGQPELCTVNHGAMTIRMRSGVATEPTPLKGSLNDDPWVQLIVTGMLAAYPPLAAAGVTFEAMVKVDYQYHLARGESGHY